MAAIKKHFSIREVARLAGFKRTSMIDYLCRTGVVKPSGRPQPGRGRSRLYTFGDIVLLRAISGLLAGGLPVRRLRTALNELRESGFKNLREDTTIGQFLVTDGEKVWLKDSADVIIDLTADSQRAFAFLVDVHEARKSVLDLIANPAKKII